MSRHMCRHLGGRRFDAANQTPEFRFIILGHYLFGLVSLNGLLAYSIIRGPTRPRQFNSALEFVLITVRGFGFIICSIQ